MGMNFYRHIFKELNEAGIHYIVVGGVAMNLLGYPRFTGDIDVLLALDHENLTNMANLMQRLGYEQRLPVKVEELGDEKLVLDLMQKKNLIAYTFVNAKEPEYNIDVIVGASLNFRAYEKHIEHISVWDIDVPVISIEDLIAMKKQSNRAKDVDDIAILLELKGS